MRRLLAHFLQLATNAHYRARTVLSNKAIRGALTLEDLNQFIGRPDHARRGTTDLRRNHPSKA